MHSSPKFMEILISSWNGLTRRPSMLCFRHGDDELGALAGLAPDGNGAVMGFDDGFDKIQSQTEAALGAAFVATVEPLPVARLFIQRDADAGVAHPDDDTPGVRTARQ